jgi:predicted regulator of amino acid metabolism with ACT domain
LYEATTTNLYRHNWFGSTGMAFLDNLEASMTDDDGMPRKTVNDVIKEILEDPEHYKLMERLKYMEDHGI